MNFSRKAKNMIRNFLFLLLVLYWIPLFWLFLSAIRTRSQTLSIPPVLVFMPTLNNFKEVIFNSSFPLALSNSLIVGAGSTALVLLIGVPAAYSLARFNFKHKSDLAIYFISTKMAPPLIILFAFYIIFSRVGLLQTRIGLVILHTAYNLPMVIWLLRGFFEGIPVDLEESAMVAGATLPEAIQKITLPLATHGIYISGILSFLFSWMEFLFASTVTGPNTTTVPVLISHWVSYTQIQWGALSAAAVIYALPMMVLAFTIRNNISKGLSFGLLK